MIYIIYNPRIEILLDIAFGNNFKMNELEILESSPFFISEHISLRLFKAGDRIVLL